LTARDAIAELERMAEASYAAMYEARPHNVKDHFEDAYGYFSQAIDVAKEAGLLTEVGRLTKRRDHVYNVFDHQFRNVGL
jgi:hypothetical protein